MHIKCLLFSTYKTATIHTFVCSFRMKSSLVEGKLLYSENKIVEKRLRRIEVEVECNALKLRPILLLKARLKNDL